MRVSRWTYPRRSALLLTALRLLTVRNHLPVVPAPRATGRGLPWRPVLFGLGAAVGFALALGRARTAQAPGTVATATSTARGREEGGLARAIHFPAPLKDSIEAELTPPGPVLFSPPDAIDPIGAEALEADALDGADDRARGDA